MRNAYRDELEAAHARADALERDNASLRAELAATRAVVPTRAAIQVSPVTLRVVSLFTATLGLMITQLTSAGSVMLFAGAAVLFLISLEAR